MPKWLTALFFISLVVAIWGSVNFYLATRVAHGLGTTGRKSLFARWGFTALSFMYLGGRIGTRVIGESTIPLALELVGSYWVGTVSIAFTIFVAAELGLLVWRLSRFKQARSRGELDSVRRYLMAPFSRVLTIVLLVILTVAGVAAIAIGRADPVVTQLKQEAPPGSALERELKIVQLTDLHLGHIFGADELQGIVRQVNELEPDIIVLTGDIFDDNSPQADEAQAALAMLQAPSGIYVTFGNHEHYEGEDDVTLRFKQLGFVELRQRWEQPVKGLYLAGVDDPQILKQLNISLDDAVGAAMSDIPEGELCILLSHRPKLASLGAQLGADLVLSGHTHAGQIPPFQLFSKWSNGGFLQGLYQVGAARLYVSAGTGTWGPRMRLFSRSEIVEIVVSPPIVPVSLVRQPDRLRHP